MYKKNLAMVDFWTTCDENNKPYGHGGKVGNEYYEIVEEDFNIRQYVNSSMCNYLKNAYAIGFKHSLKYTDCKLRRVCKNFLCLLEVYRKEQKIWFYVPDIYLFLFILLMPKRGRKIAVNVYEEYKNSNLKYWIFQKALKKIDFVFVTNQNLLRKYENKILIPDYAYDVKKYSMYNVNNKKHRVVCLGTMNEKKQIKEMVEIFAQNGYPLLIIGKFSNKQMATEITKNLAPNIHIENRYAESYEYYKLLAESMYCIIPYDSEFYRDRTSGVIQECLFLKTVPIAPESILNFSHIQGVAYNDIYELSKFDFDLVNVSDLYENYEKEIMQNYEYSVVKNKIITSLSLMLN